MVSFSLFVAVYEGYDNYVDVKESDEKIVMKEDVPEPKMLLVEKETTISSEEPLNEVTIEEEESNSEEILEEEVFKPEEQTTAESEENGTASELESQEQEVSNQFHPLTMYIGNQAISYENGGMSFGQSIIDSDANRVSTWGGAEIQNGEDGLSTHFIGHNPGIFSILFTVGVGEEIMVTDEAGLPTSYIVMASWEVDNQAIDLSTGEDTWEMITGANNGEAITLQTCIDDDTNLILYAVK